MEMPSFHRPCVPACKHECASLSRVVQEDARYLHEHGNPDAWCVTASEPNPKERLRQQRSRSLVTGRGTCVWCRSDAGLVAKNGATHPWSESSCPEYLASLAYLRECPSTKKSYTYSVFVFRSPMIVVCYRKFREVFHLSKKQVQTIQKHARRQMLASRKSESAQGLEQSYCEMPAMMKSQIPEAKILLCNSGSSSWQKESTSPKEEPRDDYPGAAEPTSPGSQSSVPRAVKTPLLWHFLSEDVVCRKEVVIP